MNLCLLCCDRIRQPIILPCGHEFCDKCFEKWGLEYCPIDKINTKNMNNIKSKINMMKDIMKTNFTEDRIEDVKLKDAFGKITNAMEGGFDSSEKISNFINTYSSTVMPMLMNSQNENLDVSYVATKLMDIRTQIMTGGKTGADVKDNPLIGIFNSIKTMLPIKAK